MNPEIYHIPANYTDAGRILGVFEIRNVVEAVLLALPTLYFCLALLPLAPKAKLIVTIVLVIPVGGFALKVLRPHQIDLRSRHQQFPASAGIFDMDGFLPAI